jgi:hypothetical protein
VGRARVTTDRLLHERAAALLCPFFALGLFLFPFWTFPSFFSFHDSLIMDTRASSSRDLCALRHITLFRIISLRKSGRDLVKWGHGKDGSGPSALLSSPSFPWLGKGRNAASAFALGLVGAGVHDPAFSGREDGSIRYGSGNACIITASGGGAGAGLCVDFWVP